MVFDTSSYLFSQNAIAIGDSSHHLSIIVHGNAVAEQCVNYDHYANIITLSCNTNLSEINQVINDSSVLEKDPLWGVDSQSYYKSQSSGPSLQ